MNQKKDSNSLAIKRITLPYEQWLTIEEPLFFAHVGQAIPQHWQGFDTIDSLSPYLNSVALIRIEGKRLYKLNGWQRLQLWQSGGLKRPDTLTVDIYDLSQSEFDALCQRLYSDRQAYLRDIQH